MTFLRLETHTLIINDGKPINGRPPQFELGAGQVFAYRNEDVDGASMGNQIDPRIIRQNLLEGIDELNQSFVDMEQLIDGIFLGLMSGENVFALSKPGTGKSTLGYAVSKVGDMDFAVVDFNDETTYGDLVGDYDPKKAMEGIIERMEVNYSKAHFILNEEIWDAPVSVTNKLRVFMESKRIDGKHIPLLSTLSVSNRLPDDQDSQAMWDRLMLRYNMPDLNDDDFETMLTAVADSKIYQTVAHHTEFRLLAAAAEFMALHIPAKFAKTVRAMRVAARNEGIEASNRRWRKIIKLAAAYSLLKGEEFSADHLIVATHCLWNEPDEIPTVQKVVMDAIDPLTRKIYDLDKLFETFQQAISAHDFAHANTDEIADMIERADTVLNKISEIRNSGELKNGNGEKVDGIYEDMIRARRAVVRGKA